MPIGPRKLFPWFLFLLAACGSRTPPNVVLITLDTTRADALGCYGDASFATPNFDSLAEEGQLFELALSSASVTPVSHASILTGRDPKNHGLRILSADGGFRLPDEVPTLTSLLKKEGYATAAVHSAFPVSAHFGFNRGFDVFESFELEMEKSATRHRWDVETFQRRSDETTDLVLDIVDRLEEPFFLWVHYWDPHDSKRLPPDDYLAAAGPDPDQWKQPSRRRYEVEVEYLDVHFGRLLEHLRRTERYDNTLFCVTADHGEGLGEHDWQGHRLLYQEQIHVPLILRLPGAPRGFRSPQLVRTTDIVPTLLDYLNHPLPAGLDGLSLRPLIEGRREKPRIAYADQINGYDKNANILRRRPFDDFLYCIVDSPWKLIYNPSHPDRSELFDLSSDPHEAHNLFTKEPEARDRLLTELANRSPWVTSPFPPDPTVNDATREEISKALSGLGYAEGQSEAPADDRWRWTCVAHPALELKESGSCPKCEGPLLLRTKRP